MTTEADLKSFDLDSYYGIRQEIYGIGQLPTILDSRELLGEQAKKYIEIKAECELEILNSAPIHKQLNALAGILTDAEALYYKQAIQTALALKDTLVTSILACTTIDDVEAITWKH